MGKYRGRRQAVGRGWNGASGSEAPASPAEFSNDLKIGCAQSYMARLNWEFRSSAGRFDGCLNFTALSLASRMAGEWAAAPPSVLAIFSLRSQWR